MSVKKIRSIFILIYVNIVLNFQFLNEFVKVRNYKKSTNLLDPSLISYNMILIEPLICVFNTFTIYYIFQGNSIFWRRKMRTVHNLLDVNKDGIISYDDFKLLADRFVRLGNLPSNQQIEFYEIIKV